MPQALTYPGVYIEEVASGVRTIVGVPTSIAAFVGRARKGPVDTATTVTSYGAFVRIFGDLWVESTLGYAVRDFFRNGGSQAIIVRSFKLEAEADADGDAEGGAGGGGAAPGLDDATAHVDVGELALVASSPGSWGSDLRVRIDHDEVKADHLFNLRVAIVVNETDTKAGTVLEEEVHRNLSLRAGDVRRVDRVLASSSKLLRVAPDMELEDDADRPEAHDEVTRDAPLWANNDTNVALTEGSDGVALSSAEVTADELQATRRGLYALEEADIFNLLCIPPFTRDSALSSTDIDAAAAFCLAHRAMLLIDPPGSWTDIATAITNRADAGSASRNAAVFFPMLRQPDPLRENQLENFAPCGAVAGVFARTDAERGVWKAPAGLAATLVGVPALSRALTDPDIGQLNPLGINCLRSMPDVGRIVWGSRTREGADALASEWKYVPVRRLTLFIEESLYRGTQWVVFEPNDEPLWSSIRLNVGAFLHSLFRQGAFQGASAREAYEVKCDAETTTQDDINRGIVNIVVRFAPLKPAEFVVIKIQQLAGQVQA